MLNRSRFTFSLNQRIDPVQPTRSASTVAGISGTSSSARTRGSNTVNDVGPGERSYRGGASRPHRASPRRPRIPNRSAIRAFGTPSTASLRISAQSSKVITPQSSGARFFTAETVRFRAPSTHASQLLITQALHRPLELKILGPSPFANLSHRSFVVHLLLGRDVRTWHKPSRDGLARHEVFPKRSPLARTTNLVARRSTWSGPPNAGSAPFPSRDLGRAPVVGRVFCCTARLEVRMNRDAAARRNSPGLLDHLPRVAVRG